MTEWLHALEASAFGAAVKTSAWLYPAANTAHILALMAFFAAVAVMDLRLLGAFQGASVVSVFAVARPIAITAFVLIAASGAAMFSSEPVSLAGNLAFLAKMALIGAALLNALALEAFFGRGIAAGAAIPAAAKTAGAASLALWLCIAAAGRLIAYV
ncbi:MAG: hypothetical protein NW215_15040 [Hyphomicrobiales bacterium]|nr:hypothetical protein [Hyphomicrobiales bacterium]